MPHGIVSPNTKPSFVLYAQNSQTIFKEVLKASYHGTTTNKAPNPLTTFNSCVKLSLALQGQESKAHLEK